jgi:ABC-2 type transport system permease protein
VAVQILVWPLGFLSNAIAPTATMPGWLGTVAEWNPLSATVAATRELFGNPGWGGASWADQHALLLAVAWPLTRRPVRPGLSGRRGASGGRRPGRRPWAPSGRSARPPPPR